MFHVKHRALKRIMKQEKTKAIKITRGCVVDGKSRKVNDRLDVSERTADFLIGIGKAVEAPSRGRPAKS